VRKVKDWNYVMGNSWNFRARCSSCSITNSFVTNAVLIERAVICWYLHQLISQTTQYLDSWLSDLEVEWGRDVPQCPIAGDATDDIPVTYLLRWLIAILCRHTCQGLVVLGLRLSHLQCDRQPVQSFLHETSLCHLTHTYITFEYK